MVAVYPVGNDRAATFFAHRTADAAGQLRLGPRQVLTGVYAGLGWIVPELLASLPTGSCYFDEVVQVRMGRWHHGRVVLVGDAAWCVSLLAGQGASLALAGADRLASALERQPSDVPAALGAWEAQLRGPVEQRQAADGGPRPGSCRPTGSTWPSATCPCASRPGRSCPGSCGDGY
jgi:2-polyprenyl-6-methoxyphenol hydroxylase-like FAD-dependent oxidoreductase